MAVIRLGVALPRRSSHLPADLASSLGLKLSSAYLVLLRMEVAAFHPLRTWRDARPGRLVSVALFLAFVNRSRDRLIAAGRYPASCSAEPGLSSPRTGFHRRAATVWLASDANGSTAHRSIFAAESDSAHYTSSRQRIVSPARRGTTVCSPNGYDAGTTHFSRLSVMVALLRGRP
jgi:hypothetical protein